MAACRIDELLGDLVTGNTLAVAELNRLGRNTFKVMEIIVHQKSERAHFIQRLTIAAHNRITRRDL